MALRQSADELISGLQKGEATLEQIARKLQEEADRRYTKPGEVNPLQLVKRIRKLASELPELQASCRDLLSSKQGLLDAAQRQLVSNHNHLKQLCEAAGAQPVDEEALRSLQDSMAEWNSKLGGRMQMAAGQQSAHLSRQDLNAALAHIAMTTD